MLRSVILRHEMPDGSTHLDWLIEPAHADPNPDARVLLAFRVPHRPDDPTVIDLDAARMPDHRRLYLDFEGPLPADSTSKGSIKRLASVECQVLTNRPERLDIMIRLSGGWTTWSGKPIKGKASPDGLPMWSFEALRG